MDSIIPDDVFQPDVQLPQPTNNLPTISINSLIAQAIQSNLSVEALERLLAMRRELKAEAAKEAFDEAMRHFQLECPPLKRTKQVFTNDGVLAYTYTPLDELITQTQELRAKHGFSFAIETETYDKTVRAVCIAKHVSGHQETSSYSVPIGAGTRIMSNSQITAAAISFATRYAFRNVFGLATADEDNEMMIRRKQQEESITDDELAILLDLIERVNISQEEIIKRFKLDNLTNLRKKVYIYITTKLNDILSERNATN